MENKKEIQQYLQSKVNPIFEQILIDLIKSKPKNIMSFCKVWFQRKISAQLQTQKLILSDSDTDQDQQFLDQQIIEQKKTKQRWYRQRKAICGQVYGQHNKITESQIPNILKKPSVNNRILFRLKSLFLFKDFDDEDTSKLISAMTEQVYSQGTAIITQGDEGNEIYIVDEGELHCFRRQDGQQIYIRTIGEGEMFGEISMLYNTKRTANIRAKTKSICFKLDRKTFNTVVKQKSMKRRKSVLQIMKKIDIFRQLQVEEKYQLQDIVQEMPVHINQYIIREGKANNKLFLVEKGKLVALRKEKNGHEKAIANFNDGDYFGVGCLVNKEPSSISIMALTTSKLYYLQIEAIERVIGPLQKILHRNAEIYERYKTAN